MIDYFRVESLLTEAERVPVPEIVLGPPVEILETKRELVPLRGFLQNTFGLGDYLGADPVASDHGDAEAPHVRISEKNLNDSKATLSPISSLNELVEKALRCTPRRQAEAHPTQQLDNLQAVVGYALACPRAFSTSSCGRTMAKAVP